jgi:RNA polymerase sigma factor (sigma-70 family)
MPDLLYKQKKERADIDELISKHKNLVYFMLGKMGQLYNQDAESAAYEALWDAIETFDVYCKTSFSGYACCLIRNAINGILRKKQAEEEHICIVSDIYENTTLAVGPDTDNVHLIAEINKHFDNYVRCKQGISRNVLLVWFSSNFETANTQIAQVCKCSISYVSRVQQDFRAYLSSRLVI